MKLKKLLCLALSILTVASVFSVMTVSAEDAPRNIDDYLIIHWDFEGEDQATQLANKAPNGNAADILEFVTDGEKSSISNGIADIDGDIGEYLSFKGDGVSKGLKLDDCKDEFTFYVRAMTKTEGHWESEYPYSLFWILGTGVKEVRFISQSWGSYATGPRVVGLGNGDTKATMSQRWQLDSYSDYVISAKKEGDSYEYIVYCGDPLAATTLRGSLPANTYIMNSFLELTLAAGKKPSYHETLTAFTKGTCYDDVRFYSKALTEDEIKSISAENVENAPPPETVDPDEFTFADEEDETTKAPDETTKAPETTANSNNAAAETEEASGGCSSAIMGFALIPAAVAVGAVVISRKKRD